MAGILVYSNKSTLALELLNAAAAFAQVNSQGIKAVSINNSGMAAELAARGAQVYALDNDALISADTAAIAESLRQLAEQLDVSIVLLSSDRRGKELAGRLAQIWSAGCLTDVKSLKSDNGALLCVRNVLGGATIATQQIVGDRQVIALSPGAFAPVGEQDGGIINPAVVDIKPSALKLLEVREKTGDSVDIEAADILVVVGQGVEDQQDLPLIQQIAKALGAEVACSKPVASDKKWLGEERIVGLSGKICKPQLAVILGVSGQVQFTVGIREAGTIVSINSDEKAFMNSMADYVLVADLKDVIPELAKQLA
ncbi:MAG: electron transfer flavoprotein subunit alpha/FixB family protein [Syntrophomonadaceae bacterium]